MNKDLPEILQDFALSSKRVTILTGAGISAESNIPTFRGPEGYWTGNIIHRRWLHTQCLFKNLKKSGNGIYIDLVFAEKPGPTRLTWRLSKWKDFSMTGLHLSHKT
jgi:NAD-dependent SIR2 family protein deacetylase